MKTRIFSIAFLIIALALGYYLANSIKTAIDNETRIKESEALIIEKLMLIRDAEKAYQTCKKLVKDFEISVINTRSTNTYSALINMIKLDLEFSEKRLKQKFPEDKLIGALK